MESESKQLEEQIKKVEIINPNFTPSPVKIVRVQGEDGLVKAIPMNRKMRRGLGIKFNKEGKLMGNKGKQKGNKVTKKQRASGKRAMEMSKGLKAQKEREKIKSVEPVLVHDGEKIVVPEQKAVTEPTVSGLAQNTFPDKPVVPATNAQFNMDDWLKNSTK